MACLHTLSCGRLWLMAVEWGDAAATPENPTALLWTLNYAAQHYAHRRQFVRALALIDEAIAHTPTVVELHQARGKLLKQAGDVAAAATAMETARTLDGQDRFINSKSTKYWQRADQLARAGDTAGLFAKVCTHTH
jgi:N-alpha-acetyltransferase 15/16, NatA auxiliary subunit